MGGAIRCIPDGVPGSFRTPTLRSNPCAAGERGYPAPVTRAFIPDEILALAHERARAREARDWAEADRLREAIETAGWRIVDRGTDFALTPAAPPDLVEGEHGALRREPQRAVAAGGAAPEGLATVVLIATDWPEDLDRALAGLRSCAGGDVGGHRRRRAVGGAGGGARGADARRRPARRSRSSGRASVSATPRRSTPASGGRAAPVVVVLDTSVEPRATS